ncbi:MAG: phenylalanine 4-monooxygenase [Bacteriovoracaceae bacterium]|jgi:phenylalanine-4-hydroxylase|nr:phenylalanine 4-monooxygenase [Bacteriovoracaceae bacterium]
MGHTYISNPVDEKGFVNWSSEENETWSKLIQRQSEVIESVACDEFKKGLEILNFSEDRVPQLPDVNKILNDCTGWGVEPVDAIIQPAEFFTLLTKKRFPAATFIRIPKELNYIKEPDIFHEIYGHTPLLTNQAYGDFMEKFGNLALKANPKDRRRLFRLFWFTIEFGLLKTDHGLKAYGGGILSSIGETKYCLTNESEKQEFSTLNVLRTPYRIDIMQPLYFVINEFNDLFSILDDDILGLIEKSKELGDFAPKYPPASQDNDKGPMKC